MAGALFECTCGGYPSDVSDIIECYLCHTQYHRSCTPISDCDFKCEKCGETAPYLSVHRRPKGFNPYKGCVKTGSPLFIEELTKRNFRCGDEILMKMSGTELTIRYLEENGFNQPIAVQDEKEELGICVPPPDISWNDIEQFVGSERYIDVINVFRQNDEEMKLTDFIKYMKKPKRTRILNVISLEVEGTKLGEMIQPPLIALQLDWVNRYWPTDAANPLTPFRPKVQKYCLMAPKGAYTDFHIDFGGTSVWYHVLRGEKIFYLIKPTEANLALFDRWMESKNRLQTFFADQVDTCYKIVIGAGTTVMLPTGWIHAVLTSEDSLVFGGNFLHNLNIGLQLRVNEMECRQKIEERFLYPHFMEIHWLAAKHLTSQVTTLNKCHILTPTYLLKGLKDLLSSLKKWNLYKEEESQMPKKRFRDCIPVECSDILDMFKEMAREIRRAERLIMVAHPPKPQRESTRMRKKPKNDDFLDYSKKKLTIFTEKIIPKKQQPQEVSQVVCDPVVCEPVMCDPVACNVEQASASAAEMCEGLTVTAPKADNYPFNSMDTLTITTAYTTASENWRIRVGGSKIYLSKDPKKKSGITTEVKTVSHSDQLEMGRTILGILGKTQESSEDFEEGRLTIDENAASWTEMDQSNANDAESTRIISTLISNDSSLKIKLKTKCIPAKISGSDNSEPGSGIEELLKASGFTRGDILNIGRIQTGSTSPSTQEAIAGMLSIGKVNENSQTATTSTLLHIEDSSDEEEHNVHQDDEYVYPSLENSSDEEEEMFKSRKKKKDEPWSPKAKVVNILPKHDRPLREGKKRKSVEKGLEAAAARKECNILVKPRKLKKVPKKTNRSSGTAVPIDFMDCEKMSSPSKSKKPKKGFATPKQRLGKILKIHKMMH